MDALQDTRPPVDNTLEATLRLFPLAIPSQKQEELLCGKRKRKNISVPPEDATYALIPSSITKKALFRDETDFLGDQLDRLGGFSGHKKRKLVDHSSTEVNDILGQRLQLAFDRLSKPVSRYYEQKKESTLTDELRKRFSTSKVKPIKAKRMVSSATSTAAGMLLYKPPEREDFMPPNSFGVKMLRPFTLFKYQQDTVSWLADIEDGKIRNEHWNPTQQGGLLAMKMGLGKSVTLGNVTMRTLNDQRKLQTPTLYICPKNLLGTIVQEMRKFFGSQLRITVYHRDFLRSAYDRFRTPQIKEHDLIISTYDTVVSRLNNAKVLDTKFVPTQAFKDTPDYHFSHFPWYRIILDESHEIRESKTKRFKCIHKLKSPRRIAMTGTPLHNRYLDVFNQLKFCGLTMKEGSRRKYDKVLLESMNLIQMIRFVDYKDASDVKLPDKKRHKIYFDLSENETFLHKYYYNSAQNTYKEIDSFYGKEKGKKTLEAQVSLLRVLQICSAPYLLTPASKQDDTEDMMSVPSASVFPGNEYINQWIHQRAGDAGLQSSKMKCIKAEILKDIQEKMPNGKPKKIVVFSNFTSTMRLVIDSIEKDDPTFAEKYVYVHGKITSSRKREELYTQFRTNEKVQILFTTLKLGSVGLNLTEATTVIFAEMWYSFAALYQAECRVHRIGQQYPVNVKYIIGKDSLEEIVWRIANEKREMAEDMENMKDFKLDYDTMKQILFMSE